MPTGTASRKTQQSERTREALLATCLRLSAHRGFARTSIDEIARAAGVTKGAMYWHFASKDDLFHAILDRIRRRWLEVVHQPVLARRTPSERLVQLFDSYAELFGDAPDICLFLQQVALDRQNRRFSGQVAKVFAKTARFIVNIIEDGKAAGVMRRDVDSLGAAHLLLGMLAGASQQASTTRARTLGQLLSPAKEMMASYLFSPASAERTAVTVSMSRRVKPPSASRSRRRRLS
jgi:AcrR family transcriptional regulator